MTEKTEIKLNDKILIPRELSVGEVEVVLETLLSEGSHPSERAAKDLPVPAVAVALSVGLVSLDESDRLPEDYLEKTNALKRLTATDTRALFEQVRLKNDFLEQEVGSLEKLGRAILEKERLEELGSESASTTSDDPPQDS